MRNNNRCCYAFVEGLGRELITVLKRQYAHLQLSSHYQESRPRYQQHVHFVGTLACFFPGSMIIHLLVPFLVVHFVGTFPGCTLCWYLSWLYTLLVPWFPGCTLCWYLGTFSWLWYIFYVVWTRRIRRKILSHRLWDYMRVAMHDAQLSCADTGMLFTLHVLACDWSRHASI